jgi:outer membrane immunogenic protein
MKKFLLGTVALVAFAAPALAADLAPRPYTKAPAPVYAPVYNWTGFYLGAHVGGAFGSDNNLFNNSNGHFLGGVQGGFDYQVSPNWVIGAEAQYSWLSGDSYAAVFGPWAITQRQNGLGSVTGRLGYTWGPGLLYVKGGYAFSDTKTEVLLAGVPVAGIVHDSKDGWTIGAGLEYMFAPNWSAKVEYQYYDLGTSRIGNNLVGFADFKHEQHTVKAGINYRFNVGGPAGY